MRVLSRRVERSQRVSREGQQQRQDREQRGKQGVVTAVHAGRNSSPERLKEEVIFYAPRSFQRFSPGWQASKTWRKAAASSKSAAVGDFPQM